MPTKPQSEYYAELAEAIMDQPGFVIPPDVTKDQVKEVVAARIRKHTQTHDVFFDEENFERLKAGILENIAKMTRVN